MYHVVFSEEARKQIKKLDKHVAAILIGWIRKNLEGCSDPRIHGKSLTADRTGQWRYRIGDYRLICQIQDQTVTVLVLTIGHRRDVYR